MKHTILASAGPNTRVLRFLVVGLINTLVGYSIYAALLFVRTPYLLALILSTIAGVIFNYFSTGRLVFRSQAGWAGFFKFVAAYGVVYLANATVLTALIRLAGVNAYIAQIVCLPASVLLSWSLMNRWVFKNA